MAILTPEDLAPFAQIDEAKALEMIADSEALASLAAPCINDPDFREDEALLAAVKAVLRGAILRWNDAGSGAISQIGSGPFQMSTDTRATRRAMFWPSEIEQLRNLCDVFNNVHSEGAFSVDTAIVASSVHQPWCALHFNANYCSCGADIAGEPIYEEGYGP